MDNIPRLREKLTKVPLKVRILSNGQELSIATGFFYSHADRDFFITNWHVVTGKDPVTGVNVSSVTAALPEELAIGIPFSTVRAGEPTEFTWAWPRLRLRNSEGVGRWYEHPLHKERVDVVAIPFPGIDGTAIVPANAASLGLRKFAIYPSLEAFVLGYPRGMSGGGNFPIWKRATIATEPDFDLDGLPRFYIDTATRDGMSGAPVYAKEVGFIIDEGEVDEKKGVIGRGERFVGVYSGRINAEDEYKAQLGIVWKERALIEILDAVPPNPQPFLGWATPAR